MVWCSYCAKNIPRPDNVDGKICCSLCGRVLDEDIYSSEPTFVKNAAGQSQVSGKLVSTIQSNYSASRERILNEAFNGIEGILYALGIDGGDSISRPALAFYTIAVERNFTRGRRKEQVEAACLYIACRENKKPYLLIDFSEYLRINVYVLGAVFLQLCKLLSLEEHPIVQKPVDPSLFIHRFTDRLFGERKPNVSKLALLLLASMKRDWMQTGRKPSGLCGASLYISALLHGLKVTKLDIIKVVHVCEATLTKRLIEFESTESGSLTVEEFKLKAEEFEKEGRLNKNLLFTASQLSGQSELLCEHKDTGKSAFAHGLCESCYSDFMQLSGGLDGGSEPPAFQRAEHKRLLADQAASENESNENLQLHESGSIGAASVHPSTKDTEHNEFLEAGSLLPDVSDESDNFSDIDDVEVDAYLHNEEEKRFKKIIWELMNKEYLEEQAAKEEIAEATRKAYEANFDNCSEDVQAAQKLAAAAAEAVAKSRKEKQQKRAAELRNSTPAQTAAEATKQMLTRKRLSSKINYDVLDKLFDEPQAIPDNSKRSRSMTPADGKSPHENKQSPHSGDDYEEDDAPRGEYDQSLDYDNAVENYDYDDTYHFDDY